MAALIGSSMPTQIAAQATSQAAEKTDGTSQIPEWQVKAGGKASFEVASIHLSKPGTSIPASFAINADDSFRDIGTVFHANTSVMTYFTFAYKRWLTPEQERAILAPLPKWVETDRFSIEARVPQGVTKDQIRLMMQSLLAERFQMTMHMDQRDSAVVIMTLSKPDVLGPGLRLHADGRPCTAEVMPPGPKEMPQWQCGTYGLMPRGAMLIAGSRDTRMELVASFISHFGSSFGFLSHPVVDETGLTGRYDFTVEFVTPRKPNAGVDAGTPAEPQGADFLEAVQEQLGVKLKPGRAVLTLPVIDHIERPTEN
ncbi:MAG TPA: TIGR03435 family protein [Acidobacteriaceae bacterium]|jgi:uncharacterized protein (TIGR03435 family)